jgi:hypothetical protein
MRIVSFVLIGLGLAAVPGVAQSFTGSYMSADGTRTVLSFESPTAGSVTGSISGQGVALGLQGEIDGALLAGWASGQGGSLHFHAEFSGDDLVFTLFPTGMDGQPNHDQGQSAVFRRTSTQPQPGQSPTPQPTPPATTPAAGAHDPALVGVWVREETMVDPIMTLTTQTIMVLDAGGDFEQGEGRVVGGGAGFSFDTGSGQERDVGQWRSEGEIVYVTGAGLNQWIPCCRYYVEGGRMLLTFDDGSRQIWHKR